MEHNCIKIFIFSDFRHGNLRRLFLTCNEIDSFEDVYEHLGKHCPMLEMLSLAECPLTTVPRVQPNDKVQLSFHIPLHFEHITNGKALTPHLEEPYF